MNPARNQLVDALRVLALLGVFVVNWASYPGGPWGGPIASAIPAHSLGAITAVGVIAGVFQNKAYPLLAFLFGYSLMLSLRPRANQPREQLLERTRTRHRRLLFIGLVHGFLIYAGDILTVYTLAGLLLVPLHRWKLKRLIGFLFFSATLWLLGILIGVLVQQDFSNKLLQSYAQTLDIGEQLSLNAQAFIASLMALPFYFLPEILVFMTSGVIAARLSLLERPYRYKKILNRVVFWTLPAGLALNFIYGITAAILDVKHLPYHYALYSAGSFIGPLLTVGLVSWLTVKVNSGGADGLLARLVRAIAPAGRNTLSMYIGLSLAMMLILSGAGAGWAQQASTHSLLLAAFVGYGLATAVSYGLTRYQLRGPIEIWLHKPNKG